MRNPVVWGVIYFAVGVAFTYILFKIQVTCGHFTAFC